MNALTTKYIRLKVKYRVYLLSLVILTLLPASSFSQIKFTISATSTSATSITVTGSGSATTNGKGNAWTSSNGFNQIFGNSSFNYVNSNLNFQTFSLSGNLQLTDGVSPINFSAIVLDDDVGSDYDDFALNVSSLTSMASNTSYTLSGSATFDISGTATFADFITGTFSGTFSGVQAGFSNFSTSDIIIEVLLGTPNINPSPKLVSIERNNPSTQNTNSNNLQFKVSFDRKISNYQTSDFVGTNTLANNLIINTISTENDSTLLVNTTVNSNAAGDVGIGIKGVGGIAGSNGIVSFIEKDTIAETGTINDYLNQATIGQTFTTTQAGAVTKITLAYNAANHNFSGTADLKIYSGDNSSGGGTEIHTQQVNISSGSGDTFILNDTIQLNNSSTYSFELSNFSGSGYAINAAKSGNYTGGKAYFTNSNASHANFDLDFELVLESGLQAQSLDGTAPAISEVYTYTPVPLVTVSLLSIERNNPIAASTTSNNMQFKVNFNKDVLAVDSSDFALSGSASSHTTIQSVNKVNGSQYLVNLATTNPTSGTLGLDIKGVDASGTNNIIEDNGVLDQQALNDIQVTNSPEFGQSFVAGASGVLTKISLRTGYGHSFTGNGVLEIYSGNGFGGTLLSSSNVYFPSSPRFTDINFYLGNPAQLTAGNTYTFRFYFPTATTNNIAVSAQTGNPYANGVIYQPGVLSSADLYFKTFVAPSIKSLSSKLPATDETYDFLVPLQVSTAVDSIQTNLSTPNGGASVSVSGGIPPYVVQWNNGAGSTAITGLSSGKYYVTVTDNNGSTSSLTQTLVDSVEIVKINLFKLTSILRNNPTDSITTQSKLQFKFIFNDKVANYFLSDFESLGSLADSLTLNSVFYETDSSCLVNATLNSSVDGSIGIGIRGVGGVAGSNGIYTFSLIDTLSVNQLTSNDYLNQSIIGQTYTAFKENLKQVVVFPKSGNHTFSGTAVLKVYLGDYSAGNHTLLHSETVSLSNSTATSGQTFELSSLVATIPGNTYTIVFEGFSGSGSHAFENATLGNYSLGHAVFTNYNSSNHSGFDLKIKITESYEGIGENLDTLAPSLNQDYRYRVPVILESILRHHPLDSVTSQSNLQFKLQFNQAVGNLNIADFRLTGQLADSATINALSALNNKEHLVDVFLNSSVDGSIGLEVKGVGGISGSNQIKGASITDTLSVDQTFTDDYLNHAVIGQTYTAFKENLKQVVVYPKSGNHTFNGIADLKVYSGDFHTGNHILLHSETVNVSNNTATTGQTFELSTLISTIAGNTYSITFENFNGSGSHAFESAIVGTYPYGHVIFSNYNSGSHSNFDLKIKITEVTQLFDKELDTTTPSFIQTYQYTIPCQPTSSVQIESACNTYNWPQNGMIYNTTGMYKDTIPNVAGCDSVITLDLTINTTVRDTNAVTACDSYVWASNGMQYTTNGIYSDTLQAVNGCDSISTIDLTINLSTSSTFSMASCDSYLWPQNGMTYNTTGMYKDTIPNVAGCDSVITLDLTINTTVRDTNAVTACDSYVWASNGMQYITSGIYSDTLQAVNGCDSISTIDLTINLSTSSTLSMASCDSYLWPQNGMTYNTTGMYKDTIPNVAGCDSVITLDLTINTTVRDTNAVTACDSYVWASNGMQYTTNGIYSDTLQAVNGCDSISTIDLTINLSTSSTLSMASCDSYLWPQNGMTYNTTGMYKDTIPNVAGCDSVITLDLTINTTVRDTNAVTACDSYVWVSNGMQYTTSGIYSDTLQAVNGCDSISTIDLTINLSTSSTLSMASCDSYLWPQNGMIYNTTGMYKDTIPNVAGCDSVITLDLTINTTVRDTNAVTACDSYVWVSNGMQYTTSGIYSDTLQAVNGCDSISTIDLTINLSTSSTLSMASCDSYLWPQNGMIYNTTGMYKDTIPNVAGCDSVITLDLTINTTVRDTNAVTACDSYVWASNGMQYTTSGIYSDTLQAVNGCDSISTIDLTINLSTSSTFSMASCDSYLWPQNGMTYNTTGMYKDTIPNVAGCDSVITLDLTINTTVRDTNAVTACDSYVWASNGMQYTTSGIYSDTLQAVNGCDSISTIDLTINLSTSSTFSMASCDSYLWPQNGMTYNTTGMYKDTIPNVAGCDSVITLDLTIDTVDTRVVRVGFDLQAQNTNLNATYQWIDCHTNTAIVGATSSTFTVVTNGSYQLEVNQSNCTDTSDCITIMNVGIEINNRKNLDFRLFPNPTKKWVNIEISELNKKDKICIYNIQGRLIKIILPLSNLSKINLYDFASGIYFVRYRNETRKMIVND